MSIATRRIPTPTYVLLEGNRRVGPAVVGLAPATQSLLIYGFSGKEPYEAFCRESQLGLRPYPLVKGYLQSQMATAETGVQLIVLDSAGPRENSLQAATMEAVLDAQQNQATHVTATHELTFDQELNSYRLESYS